MEDDSRKFIERFDSKSRFIVEMKKEQLEIFAPVLVALTEAFEKLEKGTQPDIVRCWECKYGETDYIVSDERMAAYKKMGAILCDDELHSPNWFCAAGEREPGDG